MPDDFTEFFNSILERLPVPDQQKRILGGVVGNIMSNLEPAQRAALFREVTDNAERWAKMKKGSVFD